MVLKDRSPYQDGNKNWDRFMALLNSVIVFKSLVYNIPEEIFWTFHCFISGISDIVALMEGKARSYQAE